MRIVHIGSRESKLAVIQTEMVMNYINSHNTDVQADMVTMKTTGDIILDKTLDQVGGKGLFVKELDKALLDGRTIMSVHSLKDMPMEVSDQLPLIAFSKREDPRDVLILPKGKEFIPSGRMFGNTELPVLDPDLPIGSASLRRTLQFRRKFPQQAFKPVRGNVITRLRKLDEGEYSALILAAAGVKRLGFEDRISMYFDTEDMIPAAGQAIIGVQGVAGENYDFLDGFNDIASQLCATAERAYVTALNGGCTSPVCAHCQLQNPVYDQDGSLKSGNLYMKAMYYDEFTGAVSFDSMNAPATLQFAEILGKELASKLKYDTGCTNCCR